MRVFVLLIGLTLAVGAAASPADAQDSTDSTYTVQSGDTLYSIARDFGVSVRTLMRWNDLDAPTIQPGQTLRVRPPEEASDEPPPPSEASSDTTQPSPTTADSADAPATDTTATDDASPSYGQYTVEEGDTFVTLALRLGTTADSLFALNDSTTAPLSPGRTLRLPPRFGPPTHVVESGETLYSIAGEYGVSVRALKAKNDLNTNTLEVGQRLQLPQGTRDLSSQDAWADPDSTGRVALYPAAYDGRLTASGTTYDPDDFVVSHPSLPFDSVVLLSTHDPNRHTFARVIDRGPVEEGVLLDVSDAVAQQLGLDPDSPSSIALRVVWPTSDSD